MWKQTTLLVLIIAIGIGILQQFPEVLQSLPFLLFHPDRSQSIGRTHSYFEGWYFKMVTKDHYALSIVPGIFLGNHSNSPESHAFIFAALDGKEEKYFRFPPSKYNPSFDDFEVHIGPNSFFADSLEIDLSMEEPESISIKGSVKFINKFPWPVTLLFPGAMGPFAYLPFLECFHGVVSMNHELEGKITATRNGQTSEFDFTGGHGYIEKDWGSNFPKSWIWFQSNTFASSPGTSVFISIADVPLVGFSITGLLAGILHESKLYQFSTYTLANIEHLKVTKEEVHIVLTDFFYQLEVTIYRPAHTALLFGPKDGKMIQFVKEGLDAKAQVSLSTIGSDRRVIFSGECTKGGIEVVGIYEE